MAAKWPPKYSILSFLFFPCLIGTPNIFSQSFTLAAVATFEKPLWGPTKLVGIAAVITGKCTYILCFARMHLFLGCTLCTVQGISTCRSLRQPHLMRGVATALSNSKDLQSRKLLLKRKEKKKVSWSVRLFPNLLQPVVHTYRFALFSLPPTLAYKQHC